jgi:asparagine synthase (glutamine-hydrolysing)
VSGICGICQPGAEISRARIDRMSTALAMPGESKSALASGHSAAFGASSRWPFQRVGAIEGVRVAVDADLYNIGELDELLKREGFDPTRMELAEKLARLYLLRGPDLVKHLQGGFVFAIWDERQRKLMLAVDRFGFKTLYWARTSDGVLFASRVGAVRSALETSADVNPATIVQYLLYSVVPAPLTIFRGIERLAPGFRVILEDGEISVQRYWDLEYVEDSSKSESSWAIELREEMRGAVHRHLSGCARESTGAYLSGGTDSSSVVAFMSDRFSPVNTFSISFPVSDYNEIDFARTTAGRFSTEHSERCLSPEDAVAAIPKIIRYYDEPFANSSAIASYHCALLAREKGVDTLLAGDGGDELFGGNARYATDKRFALYQVLPGWIRRYGVEPLVSALPDSDGRLSLPRRYVRRARIPNPRRILSYNFFLNMEAQKIFEPDFLGQSPTSEWLHLAEAHFRAAHASSELNRLLYMDVKMTLGDNDLRKVSGTAELAGVRVRYPLLDTKLAEFSGRIPTSLKLKGMEKRYIFKKAMKGILPDKVLSKKKHGFGVPLGEWFLHDRQLKCLVQDVLHDPRTRQRGYFRQGFLDEVSSLHEQENAGFYGEILWYLVALELWHREHLESPREVSVAR